MNVELKSYCNGIIYYGNVADNHYGVTRKSSPRTLNVRVSRCSRWPSLQANVLLPGNACQITDRLEFQPELYLSAVDSMHSHVSMLDKIIKFHECIVVCLSQLFRTTSTSFSESFFSFGCTLWSYGWTSPLFEFHGIDGYYSSLA